MSRTVTVNTVATTTMMTVAQAKWKREEEEEDQRVQLWQQGECHQEKSLLPYLFFY